MAEKMVSPSNHHEIYKHHNETNNLHAPILLQPSSMALQKDQNATRTAFYHQHPELDFDDKSNNNNNNTNETTAETAPNLYNETTMSNTRQEILNETFSSPNGIMIIANRSSTPDFASKLTFNLLSSPPQLTHPPPVSLSSLASSKPNIMDALTISKEDLPTSLPAWTLEYFEWHAAQLQQIAKHNTTHDWFDSGQFRFLIARCTYAEESCGGLSDRLRPLPLYLRLAYETQRILLLRWTRPCRLEEFLEPTIHFNWTVPEFLQDYLNQPHQRKWYQAVSSAPQLLQYAPKMQKARVLESKVQLHDGGKKAYANFVNDTQDTYETVYHGMFRAIFQPSPALAAVLQEQYDALGLIPGEYSAAHLRAFYKRPKNTVPLEVQRSQGLNAVNCASNLKPGQPVYFASDSAYSMQVAFEYGQQHNRSIVVNTATLPAEATAAGSTSATKKSSTTTAMTTKRSDPLHLDFASIEPNASYAPSEYFDTFVDLLVLGNARCISYGKGGYATYATTLSFAPNCRSSHLQDQCSWTDE